KGMKDAEVQSQLADLRKLTEVTRSALTSTNVLETRSLQDALDELKTTTRRRRWLELILFVTVVFIGSATATGIVRYGVVRPVLHLSGKLGEEAQCVNSAAVQ